MGHQLTNYMGSRSLWSNWTYDLYWNLIRSNCYWISPPTVGWRGSLAAANGENGTWTQEEKDQSTAPPPVVFHNSLTFYFLIELKHIKKFRKNWFKVLFDSTLLHWFFFFMNMYKQDRNSLYGKSIRAWVF